MRWLGKSGHLIWWQPEIPVEKAAEIKIVSRKDPVPLKMLLRWSLFQQELSRKKTNSLSLLNPTRNDADAGWIVGDRGD